jgi:hypothetical protein
MDNVQNCKSYTTNYAKDENGRTYIRETYFNANLYIRKHSIWRPDLLQ